LGGGHFILPVLGQLNGEAGWQPVTEPLHSAIFSSFSFFEHHTYKIRFLARNEKLMVGRKRDGIQYIFSFQNKIF